MNAQVLDMNAAADFIGPGAIEVPSIRPRSPTSYAGAECSDNASSRCRPRPSVAVLRGDVHSFADSGAGFMDPRNLVAPIVSPTRVERTVPLKALVSQINYNLFDLEVGSQQTQFAYLQAKDLTDTVEGVLRTHDVSLWNGTDTAWLADLGQYFGAAARL